MVDLHRTGEIHHDGRRDAAELVLVRQLRRSAGLTLEQLAGASGLSDRAISDIERGISRSPRVRTVEAIADGLRLAPGERSRLFAAARTARGGTSPEPAGELALPRRIDDFTGRDDELGLVAEWTSDAGPAPVVVVSGAPGIGKTSFAVRAARAWPAERHLFADLRGLDARPLTTCPSRCGSPATGC